MTFGNPVEYPLAAVARPGRLWLAVAVFMLSACEVSVESVGETNDEDETPPIPVETVFPVRGNIDAVYSGTAPIEAFADALVIAKVGGEIREILVEEGDTVVRGQRLALLDGDRLRLESQQALANLRKLQRDHQRNLDLKDKGLISAGDFEKIQYEMESLQAIFDLAQLELGYTEIRAPIAGVIAERFVRIGNNIAVGAETFQVTSLDPLISYLHVPEREYRRIKAGQEVSIFVDALSGARFVASVARVSPIVDPGTGTFKTTIEVSDPSRTLKPGMFGRISIVLDRRTNVLQIPRSAIIEQTSGSTVFIVVDEIVVRREIQTGYTKSANIEVLHGVDDEDEIVIVGHINLKDGSTVLVINNTGSNTAAMDGGEPDDGTGK